MALFLPYLRLIHIFAGIFWVGTTLFIVFFLGPTVQSLGQEGGRFMQKLLGGTSFINTISGAVILTVLSGLLMYGPVTGDSLDIMLGARLPLTLGSIAGLIAGGIGGGVVGGSSRKLVALGKAVTGQGGQPTAEQMAEMQRLQGRIRSGGQWTAVLMVLAVLGMVWRF